jgi:hypothetical protein
MWRVGDVVGDVESSVLNKEQLNNHGLLACLHLQQLTSHAPFILFQSPSKPGYVYRCFASRVLLLFHQVPAF